ncbi:MAG: hypothetical protein CMI63_07895 [Parvularcula sp.]|nr:hypothetical protein [Parvularcula sp.]
MRRKSLSTLKVIIQAQYLNFYQVGKFAHIFQRNYMMALSTLFSKDFQNLRKRYQILLLKESQQMGRDSTQIG